MERARPIAETGRARGEELVPVQVWDWPVRMVHGTIAVLFVVSLTTGFVGGGAMEWHLRSGLATLALVLFRMLWGFVGSTHARFVSFVRGPNRVLAYARSLARPPRAPYAGHNPLGGWFVVVLLGVLLAQAATGLFANDDVATEGPLAKHVSDAASAWFTGWHERGAWVLVALVSVHVSAAFFYLVAFGDDLIRPMITGVKRLPRHFAGAATGPVASVRALGLLGLCALAVWAIA